MWWQLCPGKLFPLLTRDDHTPLPVDLSMRPERLGCLKFSSFLQVKVIWGKSLFVDAQSGAASVQKREKRKIESQMLHGVGGFRNFHQSCNDT